MKKQTLINTSRSLIVLAALLSSSQAASHAAKPVDLSHVPQINETTEQRDARIQWFRDAKFGMFIHWGPSSIARQKSAGAAMLPAHGTLASQTTTGIARRTLFMTTTTNNLIRLNSTLMHGCVLPRNAA